MPARWIVSARFDLAVFVLPAIVALALVPLEGQLAPDGDLPLPFWVIAVLLVDVAHVWSTLHRTYLDPEERRRRPALYVLVPVSAWAAGVAFYASSAAAFWTALAYLAVFHFVRQQYGWIRLYDRRAGPSSRRDRFIDAAAIYAATVFPILWWHANLPRRFQWFIPGDFITDLVAPALVRALWPAYVAALAVFFIRELHRAATRKPWSPGKVAVVSTTALCWGAGIIATNSDWAFTLTNVLIHGIPYMAVVHVYTAKRPRKLQPSLLSFFLPLAALAYVEELGWDRLLWHEHAALFPLPEATLASGVETLIVPLLALPQATHYLLDAWIWRGAYLTPRPE